MQFQGLSFCGSLALRYLVIAKRRYPLRMQPIILSDPRIDRTCFCGASDIAVADQARGALLILGTLTVCISKGGEARASRNSTRRFSCYLTELVKANAAHVLRHPLLISIIDARCPKARVAGKQSTQTRFKSEIFWIFVLASGVRSCRTCFAACVHTSIVPRVACAVALMVTPKWRKKLVIIRRGNIKAPCTERGSSEGLKLSSYIKLCVCVCVCV